MRGSRRAFLAKFVALAGVAVAGAAGAGAFFAGCASSGPRVYRYPPSGKIIDLFLGWYPELIRTGAIRI